MERNEELKQAVQTISELCPRDWARVGAFFRKQAKPTEGVPIEELPYMYVQKATIVGMLEELGFEF